MKKILFIYFFSCLSYAGITQSVLEQKINFDNKNQSLKKSILQLSKQINIAFTFNGNIIPKKKINIQVQDATLTTILDHFLENTAVKYRMEGDRIVLYKVYKKTFYTISGYIKDAETGESLIAANIYDEKSKKGVATNEYGFFSLTLPKGEVLLNFSFLGYQIKSKRFQLKKNTRLSIPLKPSLMLEEVVVTSKGGNPNVVNTSNLTNTMPLSVMAQMPVLGGEEDLFRNINLLAGIQTGPDGFGGLNVRGGSTDQNLILLDGVPVYNATHLGGLFSIFNSSAIKSAKLYKGNFPARFGGRLSSVLDIRTKEGNQRKWAGEATIGLIALKMALEGPILKDKSSFFFSFRRSIFDLYINPISKKVKNNKGDQGFTQPSFTDLNGKINFNIGKKDQLFLSIYHGKDHFLDENSSTIENLDFRIIDHNQDLNWGNTIGSLRWNHLFSDRLFANTTLAFSKFWFDSEEFYDEQIIQAGQGETSTITSNLFYNSYNSSIEDRTLKVDFDFIPSTNHYIKFGGAITNHTFRPGAFTLDHNSAFGVNEQYVVDSLIAVNNTVKSQEFSFYAENNWTISPKFKANVGFRTTLLAVQATRYFTFQPRFSLRYELAPTIQLSASVSKMMQNIHLLTTSGVGLPTDLWVSATASVRPQEAWQTTLGITKSLKNGIELGMEAYHKRMNNLIAYQEGSSFLIESIVLDASNWEDKVTHGTGESYGVEFYIKKSIGKWNGWANYTLSKSRRQFDEINFGQAFDYRFDRPHSFKITGVYQLSKQLSFSANWVYESGIATTLPTEEYIFYSSNLFAPVSVFNTGAKNSFRLPSNHHLDIGVNWNLGKKPQQQILKIGVYNIYNRKNPLYFRLRNIPNTNGEKEFVQVTLLPITPSLSYSVRF